jgi:hypothetical protein
MLSSYFGFAEVLLKLLYTHRVARCTDLCLRNVALITFMMGEFDEGMVYASFLPSFFD